jgi:hypothetical protein
MTTQAHHNLRNNLAGCLDLILGNEPHPAELETIDAILAVLTATPLSVILDATSRTYREGWLRDAHGHWWASAGSRRTETPVLVVDNPAADEAAP